VKLAASSSGSAEADLERAEPVGFGRRPWKAWVVVVMTGGTTQPIQSEGPLLHRRTTKEVRNADECRAIG
jgi:hypothetical protein